MKRIKLKESDIQRIVKRVLTEQETDTRKAGDDIEKEELPTEIQNFIKKYNINATYNLVSVSGKLGVRFGVNQGKSHSDISIEDINTYEKNKNNLRKCTERGAYYDKLMDSHSDGPDVEDGQNRSHGRYDDDERGRRSNSREVEQQVNQKYPNMKYCGVVQKVDRIIRGGKG